MAGLTNQLFYARSKIVRILENNNKELFVQLDGHRQIVVAVGEKTWRKCIYFSIVADILVQPIP
uniref:Uncharacterized protein n=1 Tax=Anguilla anguilla TaxID=7936 RepID=A0A0E9SQN6_ANGAN